MKHSHKLCFSEIYTNIIGRMKAPDTNEPISPKITTIIVTDLTELSHGNATGMGLADIMTQ